MLKIIWVLFFVFHCSYAAPINKLSELEVLPFENAFEEKVIIPKNTKKILISFEKKMGDMLSEYLANKPKEFLEQNQTIYIGDIYKMPSFVFALFARPKMQKYPFTIYLHNQEGLDMIIPAKEGHITLLEFDENQNLVSTTFHSTLEKLF